MLMRVEQRRDSISIPVKYPWRNWNVACTHWAYFDVCNMPWCMLEDPEEAITEAKVPLGLLLHIYSFGKVSNLVAFNGLKHSLEGMYWCRYTQVGMASNRLAAPLLLHPKSKIINVIGRRIWTVTPHFLWYKNTFLCSMEEGIVQQQSFVWGENRCQDICDQK